MAITYQPLLETTTATIATGGSVSAAVDLMGGRLVGLQIGGTAWNTASITFQASVDGTTYNDLYDDSGNEVTVTAAASRFITFDSSENFRTVRYVKVRSGTTGTPVNQTAARTITLVVRP
jgi:hypothetical protein